MKLYCGDAARGESALEKCLGYGHSSRDKEAQSCESEEVGR